MDTLQHLQTEAQNPRSARLDELTSIEIVELLNSEDALVAPAVATQKVAIAQAIEAIAKRLSSGGRLIYTGAGTSGRLGVLDAAECPPTFQTLPSQVVGLIAGGQGAMFQAVEGAEDNPELGKQDLEAIQFHSNDVLVGIATSGRTPYVLGAVQHARQIGAFTVGIACTPESELAKAVEVPIVPIVGPEVLTGSTRLKAGTATKLVLNTLTTGAMVLLGKTFGNLMVDLKASNFKLKLRTNRIVRLITKLDEAAAAELLERCDGEVKTALITQLGHVSPGEARELLRKNNNRVAQSLTALGRSRTTAMPPTDREFRADLVVGFDGGGTSTIAMVARTDTGEVLGRGTAGPSNIQSVGVDAAVTALEQSLDRAFTAAGIPRAKVAAAALGLAGVDRQEGLDVIYGWAARTGLAERVAVSNDATLLLAAGTPEGWGLAVIAGTGSIAFVRTPQGAIGRCGGWGHTLGDEGSAYNIALSGLKAACRNHDRCGPSTVLLERLLKKMNLSAGPDLIPAVYRGPWDRAAIASLCPIILEAAAEGDTVALQIVDRESAELALTASAAVKHALLDLGLPSRAVPLALAGGVLLHSETYRASFLKYLQEDGVQLTVVTPVPDPAVGAIVIAQRLIQQKP
jgi:N-acetylmuramic acid 6-phosphate etherase